MTVSELVERSTVNAADAIRRAIGELDAQRTLLAGVLADLDGGNGHARPKAAKSKVKKARDDYGGLESWITGGNAWSAVVGEMRRVTPKPKAKKRAKTTNGRARPGERVGQVLEFVSRNPGHTAKEVADAIGISDLQVYRIVQHAKDRGKLRIEGKPARVFPVKRSPVK